MKVVLVTGFLNSHLISLTEALNRKYDFHLIVTQYRARKEGFDYAKGVIEREYVYHYYDDTQKEICKQLVRECDFAIFGGSSQELLEERMKGNGLSFYYTERFFKKGSWRRFIPSVRKKLDFLTRQKNKQFYFLGASGYLPLDLSLLGWPEGKCFQWGYFPELKKYDTEGLDKKRNSIVWCARLVKLKRGDLVIKAARLLKKHGYDFQLNMIGDGELREKLQKQIDKKGLADCVHLLGARTQQDVRSIMEESEIFAFTSDKYEGWGAVLNEAMNSGCAPIVSHVIGSAPLMIEKDENGLVFKSGSAKNLYKQIAYLLDHPEKKKLMGEAAYKSILTQWNAEEAVERLDGLVKALKAGQTSPYTVGPCSPARIVKAKNVVK